MIRTTGLEKKRDARRLEHSGKVAQECFHVGDMVENRGAQTKIKAIGAEAFLGGTEGREQNIVRILYSDLRQMTAADGQHLGGYVGDDELGKSLELGERHRG